MQNVESGSRCVVAVLDKAPSSSNWEDIFYMKLKAATSSNAGSYHAGEDVRAI